MWSSPVRSPRRSVAGPLLVAGVLVLGAVACSRDSDSSNAGTGDGAEEPVGWKVGSCAYQVEGPETIPDDLPFEERQVMERQRLYEPIACSDERATSQVTALGAQLELAQPLPVDDGCPDDTDLAFEGKEPVAGLPTRVMCARYLESPHPGDPGGGAGRFLVGDCVVVSSSPGAVALNDRVSEAPCDADGWFAVIVAMEPDPGACPEEALSRIESPQAPESGLCLAPGSDSAGEGLMAQPGECLRIDSVAYHVPPAPADCADVDDDFDVYRFDAFADDSGACPDGGGSEPVTGYDRPLCLR